MGRRETRRINPIARVTLTGVLMLVAFQLLIIGGALQLEAGTVHRYAPWAYEPFLRLVGEHPDTERQWAAVEEEAGEADTGRSAFANLAGLQPEAIPLLTGTNDAPAEAGIDLLPADEPVNAPVPAVTNVPAERAEVIEPVG